MPGLKTGQWNIYQPFLGKYGFDGSIEENFHSLCNLCFVCSFQQTKCQRCGQVSKTEVNRLSYTYNLLSTCFVKTFF